MARIPRVLAVAAAAASLYLSHASPANSGPLGFEYLCPLPGSAYHLPETNIILRPGGIVDPSSVAGGRILSVSGSISGLHPGRLRLTDDRKCVTFRPDDRFTPGEVVTCRVDSGLVTDTRGIVPGIEFSFTVAGPEREALRDFVFAGIPVPEYLMILENDGTPFFYRKLPHVSFDFKMQPDGRLTYYDTGARCFYALNALYAVVDSFRCGNGYSTDGHDLLLLPNGHSVLMSYDPQIVDLSQVAKDGKPNAIVIGLIIQELDQERNVVFQWRSWDHFQITDVVSHSLSTTVVDYVHGNSIDTDPDGNFILSSRHMNEVTKISRATGETLWRLGGRNNQFAFINDPIRFSHQHAVRL